MYVKIPDATVLNFGDRIVLYCTTDAAQSVYAPVEQLSDGSVVNELPVMPAAFIRTNASYNRNDWFEFALMNNDNTYAGTVWTITDPDGVKTSKKQADFEFQLTKTGTYRIEAAVAPTAGAAVVETIVAHIKVN